MVVCFSSSQCVWQRNQVLYPCWPQWELLMTLTATSAVSVLKCVFSFKLLLAFYHCCELYEVSIFSITVFYMPPNHEQDRQHLQLIHQLSRLSFPISFLSSFSFPSLPLFLSFPLCLEPDFLLGGGSEYEGPSLFHGTTAYQRHSRQRGKVTSVSWRYRVHSVCSEKAERLFFLSFFLPQQTETKHSWSAWGPGSYWAENIKCWPVGLKLYFRYCGCSQHANTLCFCFVDWVLGIWISFCKLRVVFVTLYITE